MEPSQLKNLSQVSLTYKLQLPIESGLNFLRTSLGKEEQAIGLLNPDPVT